ncbi:MAG TPA: hypothetical protein PKE40_14590 [Arachnia sp.]|nr:hypothetical protein [Arachnia sp.]HMT87571.1 hypothetical protein [Arachnia sp.]
MGEQTYLLKPPPPVRAYGIAAVASLLGAMFLVFSLTNGWHAFFTVLAGIILLLGIGLLVVAMIATQRNTVRVVLDDDGYRIEGTVQSHDGRWRDVSKVTQSIAGGHITIYHGNVRRTHLLFPGGGDAEVIKIVLDDITARIVAAKRRV